MASTRTSSKKANPTSTKKVKNSKSVGISKPGTTPKTGLKAKAPEPDSHNDSSEHSSSQSSSPEAKTDKSSIKEPHLTWAELKLKIPDLMMEFRDYTFDEIENALLLSFHSGKGGGITEEDLRSARDTAKAERILDHLESVVYMGQLRETQLGISD